MSYSFFAFGLGMGEVLVILVVVLIFGGAKRIPELARGLGHGIREFKKATNEITADLQRAIEEEPPKYRPLPAPNTEAHDPYHHHYGHENEPVKTDNTEVVVAEHTAANSLESTPSASTELTEHAPANLPPVVAAHEVPAPAQPEHGTENKPTA